MTEENARIILALADNDMVANRAGRKLYMHRNSIKWRMHKVEEETGLNALKFYDLCKLIPMAKEVLGESEKENG